MISRGRSACRVPAPAIFRSTRSLTPRCPRPTETYHVPRPRAQIAFSTSFPPRCSGSTCEYRHSYRSGSHTYGFFATERLTLLPRDVIKHFQFGCGQDNGGRIGRTDGIIGLGRSWISLVEQSASKYGRYFSYCLPDVSGSVRYLSLGEKGGSSAAFTPMLTLSDPSYYGINLVAISVGGKRLHVPQSIFSKAGTILDSGTVVTRLPQTAYNALRSAFRQAMSNYNGAGFSNYDTCYDLNNHTNASIPTVALTFHGGVTIKLVRDGIIEIPIRGSVACLAFLGNGNDTALGIIGNKQQQKFEVIYDIPGSRIGFVPDGC
ncbi:hypothetical protein MLD38_006413 [Melastoma candidum]|uniref:Uncharacterized protein n=1 Tax=Melastoma candidum TaxID=119954 RepID=A0ACB9RRJ1_9MYRT|nr:hypothetical protein MLD38_006413 [Melastoma candidum]